MIHSNAFPSGGPFGAFAWLRLRHGSDRRAHTAMRVGCSLVLVCALSCVGRAPTQVSLPAGTHVELSDVAVVWPLDIDPGLPQLLTCEQLAIFEPLTRTDEPADLCRTLRVTAARFDPCATVGGPSTTCQPQMRLVLQPVVDGVARDASIHAFYNTDIATIRAAVVRMMALRTAANVDGSGPLRVHPLLQTAAGRVDVTDVVQDVLDTATLDHFTQITVHGNDAAWTFEFREFADGAPTPGEAKQQHLLSAHDDRIDIHIDPVEPSPDNDFSLLLDSDTIAAATLQELTDADTRAARVENAAIHDAGTIDCASCHTAAAAREAARMAGVVRAAETSRHDVTPTPVFGNPQFIHAFAWRGQVLTVNQRLLHEAARSADLLDDDLFKSGVLR
jgi:hypothetical protein